jgi:hypothetical protein
MEKPTRLALLAFSFLLFYSQGASQQGPPRPPASEFNIELINLDSPSYVASVPGPGARSGYTVNADLRRIATWKPSEEAPAEVSVLRVQFWLEEGAVRVEVMAYLGRNPPSSRSSDWDKLKTVKVASRLVHENETISIDEIERFGIEPFQVKVLRAEPWSIGPPEITNKTQALVVASTAEERPVYILTVRNVSQKQITAIRWYGLENGRRAGGSGLSGARVIAAGDVFEIRQRFGIAEEAKAEGAQRQQSLKREIVIAAILFDDGAFEGEADAAAEMAAHLAGEGIQLLHAIQLLKNISPAPGEDQSMLLSKLKRDIAALGEEVDPQAINELALRFASASEDTRKRRIKEEVKNALRFVKNNLLREIERFEYKREHSPETADLEAWLREIIKNFERMSGSY